MIQGFEEWAAGERLIQAHNPLEHFRDGWVAIDAHFYIRKLISSDTPKDSLHSAIDGVPYSFEQKLKAELALFKDAGITVFFVYPGVTQPSVEQRKAFIKRQQTRKIDEAWDLYNASDPDRAASNFASIMDYDLDNLYRYSQVILHRLGVPFKIVPGSVCASMSQWEGKVCDVLYGSSELLFYDCNKVVLNMDLRNKQVSWVSRQACIDNLTNGDRRLWVDCCLLAGSSLLWTLPQIENDRSPKLRAAADLIKRNGVDGANSICQQYRNEPANQAMDYLHNYRVAFMSIKHHMVEKEDGTRVMLNQEESPSDIHDALGQRLPDEVYHFVASGAVGSRVLTWRTIHQIIETPPLDGGTSITYQTLIRDKIVPQRVQAQRLLSQSLHRFYQHKDVTQSLFFGSMEPRPLNINDAGNVRASIDAWRVRKPHLLRHEGLVKKPSLTEAVHSLHSSEFALATKVPVAKDTFDPLKEPVEVVTNALWRWLQLSDFLKPSHELEPIGVALHKAYKHAATKGLSPTEYEEPLLLGLQLLRLKLLTRENMFPSPPYHGQPNKGSETDQRNALLVCRVACLGQLSHKPIGYSGPVSRHLLAYKSIVSAVRQTNRDLLDMVLCTMWLDGAADRFMEPKTMRDIGLNSLPFLKENDCTLALAVRNYLDELATKPKPVSAEDRKAAVQKGQGTWMPHAIDFGANIQYAFNLWDALLVAVKELPKDIVPEAAKEEWLATDEWLTARR